MKRTITEENLLDLLLHGTAQDLQDTIDTIHPADILVGNYQMPTRFLLNTFHSY